MEEQRARNEMLELMNQPAFFVENGIIIQCNQAAQQLLIEPGTAIGPLLGPAVPEYEQFQSGCLYLTLSLPGRTLGASVSRINHLNIFKLDQETDQPEFRAMALAAQDLREPLAGVLAIADRLFPAMEQACSPDTREQISQMNQRLFQMLRLVSNMSDASRYECDNPSRQISQDICAVVEEIFEKAADLVASAGLSLRYTGPRESICCLVDEEKLERAIYNILSNALKFTPAGGTITASLTRKGNKLHLSIQDNGSGIPGHILGNVFNRYQRQPGLEDSRCGLGLGMVLVRAAATAHGGAVMISRPEEGGAKVTMTLSIRHSDGMTLLSNILRVDYAGERDHGLLELSDALPHRLYQPET